MNFKILTVNGQDLSGATHEEAAKVLEKAAEPITVVLRRTVPRKVINDTSISHDCPEDMTMVRRTASTQTPGESCFCGSMLHHDNMGPSTPLSTLVMSELMTPQDNRKEFRFSDADEFSELCRGESDGSYDLVREEITLMRPTKESKLGLMLCDQFDGFTSQFKVVVSDIAPDSIAAQSQKIYKGDEILEIDGSPVLNMNDASSLLCKNSPKVTFLVGHPSSIMDRGETWRRVPYTIFDDSFTSDEMLHDVTNRSRTSFHDVTVPRETHFHERRERSDGIDYGKIVSQKIPVKNGTTESSLTNISTGSSRQTGKDSGIGHTLDSMQSSFEGRSRTMTSKDQILSDFNVGRSGPISIAQEFTYVPSQKYIIKKRVSAPQNLTTFEDSADSAKGSLDSCSPDREKDFIQLSEAIQKLELRTKGDNHHRPPSVEVFVEESSDIISPWVKIARQDYEDKIRQLEKNDDVRSLHPAMTSDAVCILNNAISPSVATDNTSSAYSTGESFRSSSSNAPRLNDSVSCFQYSPDQIQTKTNRGFNGASLTCYMSSDGNSDGDGPACYLTHNEDTDSEGFEDAGVEFSSMLTSATVPTRKPVPLPRILYPPREAKNQLFNSLTASTKELWKAAATVAQSRRQTGQEPDAAQMLPPTKRLSSTTTAPKQRYPSSSSRQRIRSHSTNRESSRERSENETIVASVRRNSGTESGTTVNNLDHVIVKQTRFNLPEDVQPKNSTDMAEHPKFRRSSDHVKPNKKHLLTQRSFSCVEAHDLKDGQLQAETSREDVRMEWKVRVSRDGTRYITKRPVRERLLRHREKRILAERCGVTTDDDVTEMKLGRHWSRDERKRQLRIAREKKRRREFMQRCRLEALNENAPADGEIVELSHKKMTKQKHKRMLLDSFVTVQEILAHGDRCSDVAQLNPLLSVTYI